MSYSPNFKGSSANAATTTVVGALVESAGSFQIASANAAIRKAVFFDSALVPTKFNFEVAVNRTDNALTITPSTAVGGSTFTTPALTISSTGAVALVGTRSNDDAAAGQIGEFISANSAGVSPAGSTVITAIASLNLTAGDWDVSGTLVLNVGSGFVSSGPNNFAMLQIAGPPGSDPANTGNWSSISGLVSGSTIYVPVGPKRFTVNQFVAPVTVYLAGMVDYSVLGPTTFLSNSFIRARRVR